jgi:hypothetical protein
MTKPQSTAKTERKKTVPKSAWKPGQSGNPGGRPKNEQSISYWLLEFGSLTPRELSDRCAQYAAELKKVKGDMSMFAHIALRALMGQINEPSPGLFALILERTEGKVSQPISGDPDAPLKIVIEYADSQSHPARPAPGATEDQSGA